MYDVQGMVGIGGILLGHDHLLYYGMSELKSGILFTTNYLIFFK